MGILMVSHFLLTKRLVPRLTCCCCCGFCMPHGVKLNTAVYKKNRMILL